MTIEQLAEKTCKTLNLTTDSIGYSVIKRALQEQDKLTRHACANALVALPFKHKIRSGDRTDYYVWLDDAHAACINVKTE